MGREIRHVPPDWEHPIATADDELHPSYVGHPRPLYDKTYREAAETWWDFAVRWMSGDRPAFVADHPEFYPDPSFPWEYDGPPDRKSYREREWTEDEATAFQVYETVSEGTPVSPVCATEEDLVAWLTDQNRDDSRVHRMSEEAARKFIEHGSVPSLMVSGGVMAANVEVLEPEFEASLE